MVFYVVYEGLFIELKNSALFFVSFNFEFINSMASIDPIEQLFFLKHSFFEGHFSQRLILLFLFQIL